MAVNVEMTKQFGGRERSQVAVVFARSGSEALHGSGNTVNSSFASSVARSQKNFWPVHKKNSANLGKSSANFQKHQFHNALFSCSVY